TQITVTVFSFFKLVLSGRKATTVFGWSGTIVVPVSRTPLRTIIGPPARGLVSSGALKETSIATGALAFLRNLGPASFRISSPRAFSTDATLKSFISAGFSAGTRSAAAFPAGARALPLDGRGAFGPVSSPGDGAAPARACANQSAPQTTRRT